MSKLHNPNTGSDKIKAMSLKKHFGLFVKYRLHWISLLLVLLFFTARAYVNHLYFLDFVDEEDNFLIGKYLLGHWKLYSDLFSQHQPLTYILSAFLQFVSKPENILLVVKRHREFMILWAAMWSVLLTVRFGLPLLIPVAIFELVKITLLGNMFLAESLVAYPLMYVVSYVLSEKMYRKSIEIIFIGILFWFIFFNLLPTWPLLAFIGLVLVLRSERLIFTLASLGALLIFTALVSFSFSSLKDYLYSTIILSYKHYIPLTSGISGQTALFEAFLKPVYALFHANRTPLSWVITASSASLLLNLVLLVSKRKNMDAMLIILFLGLSALRHVSLDSQFYTAFHLIPWFIVLITSSSITTFLVIKQYSSSWIRYLPVFLLALSLVMAGYQSRFVLFDKRDRAADYHIHYSRYHDYSEAVKVIAKPGDRLFAVPVANLVYWGSGIEPASKYFFFYGWMENVPEFTAAARKLFLKRPPAFLWCECSGKKITVSKYLDRYVQIKKDGQPVPLYVRENKVIKLTLEEKDKLGFYRFGF